MNKIRIKFNGSFLNRFPPTIHHGDIVNIYIVYEITSNYDDSNYPSIENCLFGSVKLTKNAGINIGRNVIIFGIDMSSSSKIDNRKKDISILGKGTTQGLEHKFSAEKLYSIY